MKRIAVCIGNDNYKPCTSLTGAVNDAKSMNDKLLKLGFFSVFYHDLGIADLSSAVNKFELDLASADAGLFYYAGHGMEVNGHNVLVPTDYDPEPDAANPPLESTIIHHLTCSLDDMMEELKKYPDKTKILILDACRSEMTESRGTDIENFAAMSAPKGSIIAFSTSPGEKAKETTVDGVIHGRYTAELLNFIDLPRVPIETVFKKTRESMVAKYHSQQIPWEHTSLVGDFYFNEDSVLSTGFHYTDDALADEKYIASDDVTKALIDDISSGTFTRITSALKRLGNSVDRSTSANDLFVIGRRIFRAADRSITYHSFDAERFIGDFCTRPLDIHIKEHILNGMAYDMYYDTTGELRSVYNPEYADVMDILEHKEFHSSQIFIRSVVEGIHDRPLYIPGSHDRINVLVGVEGDPDFDINDETDRESGFTNSVIVRFISIDGKDVFSDSDGKAVHGRECSTYVQNYRSDIDKRISLALLAPSYYVRTTFFGMDGDSIVATGTGIKLLPNFTLRWHPEDVDPAEDDRISKMLKEANPL